MYVFKRCITNSDLKRHLHRWAGALVPLLPTAFYLVWRYTAKCVHPAILQKAVTHMYLVWITLDALVFCGHLSWIFKFKLTYTSFFIKYKTQYPLPEIMRTSLLVQFLLQFPVSDGFWLSLKPHLSQFIYSPTTQISRQPLLLHFSKVTTK